MFSQEDLIFMQMTPKQAEEYIKQMSSPEMVKISAIAWLFIISTFIWIMMGGVFNNQ